MIIAETELLFVEENYDIELINSRKQRLVDALQENVNEFAGAANQEDYIISIHVREFSFLAREFESIYALKIVLEGVIEDYEMDMENILYKIIELMEYGDDYNVSQDTYKINNENAGYIYLMINPSMSGIVKIGLTRRSPEERGDELSRATGVPTPFILVYKEQFNDCVRAEKLIHSILEERGERVSSNREFFSTEISDAIKIIQEVKKENAIDTSSYVEQDYGWYDDKPISKDYLEKGIEYLNGYGDYLQDYDRAIEYLEKAGELGEAQAFYELGNLFIHTGKEEEITLDAKKAIKYYEKGRVLTGKYANYCNAGLALCYVNDHFTYTKIKSYAMNDANAEKCWEWFFNNLDFNNSDYLAGIHIRHCLDHFLLNNEVSNVYKNKLEPMAVSAIKMCRYEMYKDVNDSPIWKDIHQYLLSKFPEYQLNREIIIKWTPNQETSEEEGTDFDVLIEKGSIKGDDVISFNGYGGANRIIRSLWKDGIKVSILNEGEKGIIKVESILDDFDGFLADNLTINVIGNDTLEERVLEIPPREIIDKPEVSAIKTETSNEKGLLGKMKSWFS